MLNFSLLAKFNKYPQIPRSTDSSSARVKEHCLGLRGGWVCKIATRLVTASIVTATLLPCVFSLYGTQCFLLDAAPPCRVQCKRVKWVVKSNKLDKLATRVDLLGRSPLNRQEALELLLSSSDFCRFFTDAILAHDCAAFFWEVPAFADSTMLSPFEFVLVESTELSNSVSNPTPFSQHFGKLAMGMFYIFRTCMETLS